MPTEANCPLTALVVEANVPATPELAAAVESSIFLVGHIDGLAPGVVVQPAHNTIPPSTHPMILLCRFAAMNLFRVCIAIL